MSKAKNKAFKLGITPRGLTLTQEAELTQFLETAKEFQADNYPLTLEDGKTEFVIHHLGQANNFYKRITGQSLPGHPLAATTKRVTYAKRALGQDVTTAETMTHCRDIASWAVKVYGSDEKAIRLLTEQYVRASDASVRPESVIGAVEVLLLDQSNEQLRAVCEEMLSGITSERDPFDFIEPLLSSGWWSTESRLMEIAFPLGIPRELVQMLIAKRDELRAPMRATIKEIKEKQAVFAAEAEKMEMESQGWTSYPRWNKTGKPTKAVWGKPVTITGLEDIPFFVCQTEDYRGRKQWEVCELTTTLSASTAKTMKAAIEDAEKYLSGRGLEKAREAIKRSLEGQKREVPSE